MTEGEFPEGSFNELCLDECNPYISLAVTVAGKSDRTSDLHALICVPF